MKRPSKLVRLVSGVAIGNPMHKGLAATWNWLLGWVANFAVGPGLELLKRETDTPELRLALEAGKGISISWAGNKCKISAKTEGDDEDGGGGGRTSGGGGGTGNGASNGGSAGGGSSSSGGGSSNGGGAGDTGWDSGEGASSDSCNTWSGGGMGNGGYDAGMSNNGDDCNLVNGW